MHFLTIFVLFLIFSQIPSQGLIGRTQSAGVQGQLLCNGKPAANILIKLYDDDRGIDTDDFMGETRSDSQGFFKVQGKAKEITTIDPKFNIYHDCSDGLPCKRKISIMIPDSYVSTGETPKKLYDAGKIELSGKFKGETRDCLHK